jgi:hypothetical protein
VTIEKRAYFLGIPYKKELASPGDIELRSPKLSLKDKTICVTVESDDTLTYFKDGFSETVAKETINKRKPRIHHALFTSYRYKWKKTR